jgi:hypothetical protein
MHNKIQSVINEVADVSVYCTSTMCNFSKWIMKVASLVPGACSYSYSRSRIYRNISNFIYDILDFSTNFMEKCYIFIFLFIIPLFKMILIYF